MRPRVSLIMIVKDEAEALGRCLGSVADLVGEVVVVDTGSADATREVALRYGAVVVELPWPDDFAAARNESLRHASGEWAFWLDADEWLDEADRARLVDLFGRLEDGSVYLLNQSSPLSDLDRASVTIAQPRLFPNVPGVGWRYRVHEQVLPSCLERGWRVVATEVLIRHEGYATTADCRRKEDRNRRLLAIDLAESPDDPYLLFQLGRGDVDGRFDLAEAPLRRALAASSATDPLRRQVYALLVKGCASAGRLDDAGRLLRDALASYPGDTNLLAEAAAMALHQGDHDRAESIYNALLSTPADPGESFGPVDPSWRGWQSHHGLAVLRFRQGRDAEAESHWRSALAAEPSAVRPWLGLAEVLLSESRWDDFDRVLATLRSLASGPTSPFAGEVPLLDARAHLARGEFPAARVLLHASIAGHPSSTRPRLLLARSFLLEGDDLDAAGRALDDLLALDPGHDEGLRHREALRAYFDGEDDAEAA